MTATTSPGFSANLGSTGIQVSPLGVGTWAWGDSLFWGYGKTYRDSDLEAAFYASLERGITLFDTAEIYGFGRSEQLIGQFLKQSGQSIQVATKLMPFPWKLGSASVLATARASLKRLGLESVDLYQIHWPLPPMSIETWMEWLAPVVQSGLAKALGVSNYSADQLRRAHAALDKVGIPLASNQVEYSLLHRDPEHNGVMAACQELGVTLMAYSPLGMGLLTGKYSPTALPEGPRRFKAQTELDRIQPLLQELEQIGQSHGKTSAQVALNWVMAKGSIPIPGAKSAQQARDNAGALGWILDPEDIRRLDQQSLPVER